MSNQTNFLKIHALLDKVNGVLRQHFLKQWRNETGEDWSNESVSQFVSGVGKWVYGSAGRIQREALWSGDVNRWDTTLITDVLIHTQFKKSVIKTNEIKKERKILQLIKNVRNRLCHDPSVIRIENELFNNLWADAVEVFEFFGGSMSEINIDETTMSTNGNDVFNITVGNQLREEENVLHKNAVSDEPIRMYTKAISRPGLSNSELAILYTYRSDAYLELSKSNESQIGAELAYMALQDAKEAVERNRTWFHGYECVGNAYVALQKFDKALKYFDAAFSFCPSRPDIITARDNCRMKISQRRRQEELNPANTPCTYEELVDHFRTRIGFKDDGSAAKKILDDSAEMRDKVCSGAMEVQEAHKLCQSGNYELAAKKYSKAATLGNADGLYNLGLLYKHGKGVTQDFKMYVKLLRKAASQPHLLQGNLPNIGVVEAEHCLGLCYDEGTGVKEDGIEAAMWYKKASDHGNSAALNNLASLFAQGRGVPLDFEKALQFWRHSASLGNVLAMNTLANYYLECTHDATQAEEWHLRAVKHGSLEAKLNDADFKEKLNDLKKKNEQLEVELTEIETRIGINSKGLDISSRAENVLNSVSPESSKIWKDLQSIHIRVEERRSSPTTVLKSHNFDIDQISKYAENGSKTALELIEAHEHFENGTQALINPGSFYTLFMNEESVQHWMMFHFSECCRIAPIVVQLPQFIHSKLLKLVDKVLKSLDPNERSDLDRWTRMCYAYLNPNNFEHCLEFAKCSQLKYPEEICFHRAHVSMLGFLKRYDEGASEGNKSLEQFPNDPELLFSRAAHMRLVKIPNIGDVIAAYEQFICAAPPDHRKVPEAYYSIANMYILKLRETAGSNLEYAAKVEEFYQKGMDAEGIQLPCFPTSDCTAKDLLVQVGLKLIRNRASTMNQPGSTTNVKSAVSPESARQRIYTKLDKSRVKKLTDGNRVFHIKAHRRTFAELQIMLKSPEFTKYNITNTHSNAKKQKFSTLQTGFKEITFNEMESCGANVYEGFAVEVTSIEDPCGLVVFPSIQLALEDKNTNVMRAFVYNFSNSDPKVIEETLGFGAKFTILNPDMRLASDGLFGIRVDDVSMLVMHSPGRVENKCRFCLAENPPVRCGRCKRASYCNADCQKYDWKILEHKLVCLKVKQNKN